MQVEGYEYGKTTPRGEVVHLLADQGPSFHHKSCVLSLCGLDVLNSPKEFFTGKKVCKSCLRKALARGWKVQYRLPELTAKS